MNDTPQPRPSDQLLEAQIRGYLARRTAAIGGLPTAEDSIRELTARLAGTGSTNQGRGRTKTMFNATKVAAAIAVLTLGTGLVLSGVELPSEAGPAAPGAEATFAVPGGAFFTGEMRYDGRPPADAGQPQESEVDGLVVTYAPVGFEGQTFTTSDPRLTGSRSELDSSFISDGAVEIWTERSVIENADGAWACILTNVSRLDVDEAPPVPLSGWCAGSGAYNGLHAYMSIQTGAEAGGTLPLVGFVSDTVGPLLPANE